MVFALTQKQMLEIKDAAVQVVLANSDDIDLEYIAKLRLDATLQRDRAAVSRSRYDRENEAVTTLNNTQNNLVEYLGFAERQAQAQRFVDELHDGLEYLVDFPIEGPRHLADMVIGCVHQQLLAEAGLSGTPRLDFSSNKNHRQASVEKTMRLFVRPKIYKILGLEAP